MKREIISGIVTYTLFVLIVVGAFIVATGGV